MTTFSPEVVTAVLRHMNGDHTADNLVIVQAFGEAEATSATMTGLDGQAGEWLAEVGGNSVPVRIEWQGPVVERADIRREVVVLYDAAREKLGLGPREEH